MYDDDDLYHDKKLDADALIAAGVPASEAWARVEAEYASGQTPAGAGLAAGGPAAPTATPAALMAAPAAQPQPQPGGGTTAAALVAMRPRLALPPKLADRIAEFRQSVPDFAEAEPDPLNFPGLLGDIAYHYLDTTSLVESALPSLVGGLAGLSACIGYAFEGNVFDRADRSNLMVGFLAPTAAGKEDTKKIGRKIVSTVRHTRVGEGGDHNHVRVNVGGFASPQGIHETFTHEQQYLLMTDELGKKLIAAKAGKDPQLVGIMTKTMELISDDTLDSVGYAQSANNRPVIDQPHLATVEMSTPKTFIEGLPEGSIEDGYLNRHIVVHMSRVKQITRPIDRNVKPLSSTAFKALSILATEVYAYQLAFDAHAADKSQPAPVPIAVNADVDAQAVALLFKDWCQQRLQKDDAVSALYARSYMLAKRVALVIAVGEALHTAARAGQPGLPQHLGISANTMFLACQFVAYYTNKTAALVMRGTHEDEWKRVLDHMKAAVEAEGAKDPEGWANWSAVCKRLQSNANVDYRKAGEHMEAAYDMELLETNKRIGTGRKAGVKVRMAAA